ncbi:hypothetical protein DY000_02058923 [Brassica cretica]|uniref:DUF1985 domain-containing protein n=1 Tax=Brassica cretica TaxID=69181 RepID=A0ABQ7AWQ5_BRACR|nr:hypothetical protein DY000_02058923 [Brassica cretica]
MEIMAASKRTKIVSIVISDDKLNVKSCSLILVVIPDGKSNLKIISYGAPYSEHSSLKDDSFLSEEEPAKSKKPCHNSLHLADLILECPKLYPREDHWAKKMNIPELPRRIHTLGEEPPAVHIISYHTCWTLHTALKKALHDDEYEELKELKLGVFIKFQELGFDWASRLVHYMLGFQLNIKKKYELWSLVGPEPVRFSLLEFENLTGLNSGPSTQEIIAAFERCEGWSRDDHKRLAYLAIFTGYIEGRKYSTPTRVSLARLVMELERFENYPWGESRLSSAGIGANYGNPLPNNPSPPILAYKGRKGRRQLKEAILDAGTLADWICCDFVCQKPWPLARPLMAETLATRAAINFALSLSRGIDSILVLSDSQVLINTIIRTGDLWRSPRYLFSFS